MGLTLAEKILLKASSKKKLEEFIYAKVDFCFGNDITAPLAVKQFSQLGFNKVFNRNKIGFICDHFLPARDLKAANNAKLLKNFSQEFKIKHFYDINHCGVEHVFLLEKGLISPGDLVVGADSHTCTFGAIGAASCGIGSTDLAAVMAEGRVWLRVPETIKFIYKGKLSPWLSGKDLMLHTIGKIGVDGALYKAMQFSGPVISKISVEDRLTMSNMAIEAGAKYGLVEPDKKAFSYLSKITGNKFRATDYMKHLKSDPDAVYDDIVEVDVSTLEPQVACPHLPSNVKAVSKLKKVKLTQVVIGSCTNGRISDLRKAAEILKGRKVKPGLRALVIPASPDVFYQAQKQGLLDIFLEANCLISPPTCGPCLGGHAGILDKGEVALATTNRNFLGRMGHPESFVYLSSPAVAAASAIKGRITHPEEVV
jgi:3-isopropylmalate/(R)-2-methylmalate dehydratase large subunit